MKSYGIIYPSSSLTSLSIFLHQNGWVLMWLAHYVYSHKAIQACHILSANDDPTGSTVQYIHALTHIHPWQFLRNVGLHNDIVHKYLWTYIGLTGLYHCTFTVQCGALYCTVRMKRISICLHLCYHCAIQLFMASDVAHYANGVLVQGVATRHRVRHQEA